MDETRKCTTCKNGLPANCFNFSWRPNLCDSCRANGQISSANSRASRLGQTHKLTLKEWQEVKRRYGNKCVMCDITTDLEIDHVIPLSKNGSHAPENLQPLCRHHNCSKNNGRTEFFKKKYAFELPCTCCSKAKPLEDHAWSCLWAKAHRRDIQELSQCECEQVPHLKECRFAGNRGRPFTGCNCTPTDGKHKGFCPEYRRQRRERLKMARSANETQGEPER